MVAAARDKPFLASARPADAVRSQRRRRLAGLVDARNGARFRRGDGRWRRAASSRCRTWGGTRCTDPHPPLWDGVPAGAGSIFSQLYVQPRADFDRGLRAYPFSLPARWRRQRLRGQFHPERASPGIAAARQLHGVEPCWAWRPLRRGALPGDGITARLVYVIAVLRHPCLCSASPTLKRLVPSPRFDPVSAGGVQILRCPHADHSGD